MRWNSVGKWTWECPICHSRGRKYVSHCKAKTYARKHIIDYHNKEDRYAEPIMIRKGRNDR